MKELEVAKDQVHQELDIHTLNWKLFKHKSMKLLSEEELRAQALVEIEEARQRDI